MKTATDILDFLSKALPVIVMLVPIVIAIVTWLRQAFNLAGRWLMVASLISGIVLGGAVLYGQVKPVSYSEWVGVVLVSLIIGLTASGVYDTGKLVVERATEKALGVTPQGRENDVN